MNEDDYRYRSPSDKAERCIHNGEFRSHGERRYYSRGSRLVEPGGGEALASPTPGDTRFIQLRPANILAC